MLTKTVHFKDQIEVYLRQYFIASAYRRKGYGREGIHLLKTSLFPSHSTLIIDVLERNSGGYKFWKGLGFEPYCTTMKLSL